MPSSLEDINLSIIRLKKLKFDYAHQKGILDVIGAELDEVKENILETLKEAKALSYKTETGTVSINRRQTVKVVDEDKLSSWILASEHDIELADYMRLDIVRLKPLLDEVVFHQGEVIDGTEVETKEYISLRAPKEEK